MPFSTTATAQCVDGNHGTLGYEPVTANGSSSRTSIPRPDGAADHWNHRADEDYYSQPGKLFRLMKPDEQQRLFENTARAMGDAPREIKIRHIGNCLKADPAYGKGVADALGIPLTEVPK